MAKFKHIFATFVVLTFAFVVVSQAAFAAVPELPSPFGDTGSLPSLEPAATTDTSLPKLEPATKTTTDTTLPKLEPKTTTTTTPKTDPKPAPTPTPAPAPAPTTTTTTTTTTPAPTPKKIVKTGPELAYLLVPSLALGYIYRRKKKQN